MDPDGKWLDTFMDIVGIAWDIVEIVATPANPWAWAALGADVGCLFIPGATGAGKVIRITEGTRKMGKVSRAAKAAGVADAFVDAVKDGERVFGKYSDLQKVTKGYKSTIEAHHLVPQALADLLHQDVGDFASVVIDKATHSGFSKEWNDVLDEIRAVHSTGGLKAAKAEILKHAERIYKDFPEMREVTKAWLDSI
ncbi:hypothetical protein [Treponema zioleckii]|uniref:hypothetical protein n=1 Tax=Treponema zioleckii TaxID=331680 RepID=UPI00168BC0E9|nr:hypothetical protein [Treponema zioleckii]